jgi:hypothetical protein
VPAEPWAVKVFQRHRDDDPTERCPAEEFLTTECPESVRADLIAIVDAVAESPPPQFTGGGMWEVMHGGMAGFYEARTRGPDRRLYRLFCLLEREAPGAGWPVDRRHRWPVQAGRHGAQFGGLRAHPQAGGGVPPPRAAERVLAGQSVGGERRHLE